MDQSTGARGFTEASPTQVRAWLADNACVLVDVREADEFAHEHIEGAVLNPLSKFDPRCVHAAQATRRIVFHCKAGRRSADAAARALTTASTDIEVVSMAGGIDAWKQASFPVQSNLNTPRATRFMSVMQQTQCVIGGGSLLGSALAYLVHPAFVAIPAFFGAGLLFAGITGTCGLAVLLAKMPWNKSLSPTCASGSCSK